MTSYQLITTLNENQKYLNLSKMSLIRNNSMLLVQGISKIWIWKLINEIHSLSYKRKDLTKSKILINKNENQNSIYFTKQNMTMMYRPLKKGNTQLVKLFDTKGIHYKVLPNGDIFTMR